MEINQEAIKYTKPWEYQDDSRTGSVWYTKNGEAVYAITLQWPENNVLKLGSVKSLFKKKPTVTLLGHPKQLNVRFL